jgi:lipopolysaccharide/colanic/teichoic acid biosynthesis glycosyltransferase
MSILDTAQSAIGPVSLASPPARDATAPTLWGLDHIQLHDYYWAARGVQVVRLGDRSALVEGPELYLLTDHDTLVLARTRAVVDILSWIKPVVLIVRVHDTRQTGYREHAVVDGTGCLQKFERLYGGQRTTVERIAFTRDPDIARAWQAMGAAGAEDPNPWRTLRRNIAGVQRETTSIKGRIYARSSPEELAQFAADLVTRWPNPASTITRARRARNDVWSDSESAVHADAAFVDKVWVGAGRSVAAEDLVVGPAILWDDPAKRPNIEGIRWRELEQQEAHTRPPQLAPRSSLNRMFKRLFDIVFALVALLLTLPVYPFVMLAILIEDGRPIFFAHRRETLGGREFPCLKFRSMRKDAEKIKAQLAKQNQADGPQFFMENDPRLTRVGAFIRKTNLDELPQFFNVLVGHMSIVGPRPSPRRENQYCPAWREARLSVRPGITGLWQVNRTRIRGADFQEWIKYDIEYVENQGWLLDLRIIWKTVLVFIRGVTSP